MNELILSELYRFAELYLTYVDIAPKVYTSCAIRDLNANPMNKAARLELDRTFVISQGSFTCSFALSQVFRLVCKFEALTGRKRTFTVVPKDAGKLTHRFSLLVTEEVLDAAKFTDTRTKPNHRLYTYQGNVFIDVRDHKVLGTDALQLYVADAEIKNLEVIDQSYNRCVLIEAAIWKKLKKGRIYHFEVSKTVQDTKTRIYGDAGEEFISNSYMNRPFPIWQNFYNPTPSSKYLELRSDESKFIGKQVDRISKLTGDPDIMIEINNNEVRIHDTREVESITFYMNLKPHGFKQMTAKVRSSISPFFQAVSGPIYIKDDKIYGGVKSNANMLLGVWTDNYQLA